MKDVMEKKSAKIFEEEKRKKLSLGFNETQLLKKAEESMRSPKWKVSMSEF